MAGFGHAVDALWFAVALYPHTVYVQKCIVEPLVANRQATLGNLLDRFDLEFFGVTLVAHGSV